MKYSNQHINLAILVFSLFTQGALASDCDQNYVYKVLANDFHIKQVEVATGNTVHEAEIKVIGVTSNSISFKYVWDKGKGVAGFLVFGRRSNDGFYTFNSWGVGYDSENPISYFTLEAETCKLVSEKKEKKTSRTVIELVSAEEYKVYEQSLNEENQWINNYEYFQQYIKNKVK